MSWIELGQVNIGHAQSEHVRIEIVSEGPDEWCAANVDVSCGGWNGMFRWQFFRGELRAFGQQIQELHRTLSGVATLDPMEPNLVLNLLGDGKGHVSVEGKAQPQFYSGAYLVFKFSIDQTELPAIATALLEADPA